MKTVSRPYHQGARAESAEATGTRILQAFLNRLLKEWFDEITLDQVAEDAGVTVQTVIRRFGGKEGMLTQAVAIFADQINAQRTSPPGDVELAVEKLIADYEKTGEAVLRLLALEARHSALKSVLELGRSEHRRWVSRAFDPILAKLTGTQQQRALDELVVVTDVYTWKLLRRDMGRSIRSTAGTMKDLISSIIQNLNEPRKANE
ncbi:MAG TPA: TetR/AcrR family transcriptional regulator [Candidatus Dormibacteraeota bacterium]|nr:TetR/AcrR family transcriptional regulator [Candidatus Dormibacteraeota bacterium]